jgi:hypothetical protein
MSMWFSGNVFTPPIRAPCAVSPFV